jgi:hypothetical protein
VMDSKGYADSEPISTDSAQSDRRVELRIQW